MQEALNEIAPFLGYVVLGVLALALLIYEVPWSDDARLSKRWRDEQLRQRRRGWMDDETQR